MKRWTSQLADYKDWDMRTCQALGLAGGRARHRATRSFPMADTAIQKADQTERRFYRFFSFDTGGRIALAEDHECDSDRSALALGQNILAGKNCPKMEVWFRKERI